MCLHLPQHRPRRRLGARRRVDEWYFREFSEKKAYPLGINIVTYALTH